MNSHQKSIGNIYLVLSLLVVAASCAPFQQKQELTPAQEILQEVSLKEDKKEVNELRKDVPERRRKLNDQLKVIMSLMNPEFENPPSRIRSKFDKLIRRRRNDHREMISRAREKFREKEKKEREEFLEKIREEREDFREDVAPHVDRDAVSDFYKNHSTKRKDFFARLRERRDEFESEIRQISKDFNSNMREWRRQFRDEYRIYRRRYREHKERKEKQRGF